MLKIGDIVVYTGETEYAFDIWTSKLMENLIIGNKYTITRIGNYNSSDDSCCYKFKDTTGWFPYKSFEYSFSDKFTTKYGLR